MKRRRLKIWILAIVMAAIGFYIFDVLVTASLLVPELPDVNMIRQKPPTPSRFSPSNATTETGEYIPIEQFIPSQRCASCHQETHAGWAESLHRNAARNPFYKASVDILEKQRGIEFTVHCESCHTPTALFSGALIAGSKVPRDMDDEGVNCVVCHSITEARLDGNGSYTIRQPALIVKEDGTRVYGDLPDKEILRNIEGHKRAMMRPLLRSPEFCATCHKASAPAELNNYKAVRAFSAYDEWQMSGASTESITPYYRREKRADCSTCHMPMSEAKEDLAADNGLIKSHRFLGANTMTPLFYGQTKQVELTKKFLEDGVVTADIFLLRNDSNGQVYPEISTKMPNKINANGGDSFTVDVVIFNRKAAHSFPPEVRDLYEPWVEFEAIDDRGNRIFHSGFIKDDKNLDDSANVYKSILLNIDAKTITRHQVWSMAIKAYDNFIPAGGGDLVRYKFSLSTGAKSVKLRTRVNYRRFTNEYSEHVFNRLGLKPLEAPIAKMAETVVDLEITGDESKKNPRKDEAVRRLPPEMGGAISKRWNDYGIALFEESQFGAAVEAFRKAFEADPKNPDPYVSAAIAEMRMERFSPEQEQIRKAMNLIDNALKVKPGLPRALFYRAVVLRAQGKVVEAAMEFEKLSIAYPKDREVQRQYGQTMFSLGQLERARLSFERILTIDPTDTGAFQFLASIYASEGRMEDAAAVQRKYLQWRDDPLSDWIAARFFVINPQWAEVRVPFHAYSTHTPPRPVATGVAAAPAE